jgi:NDP-sugar pyrophosphorylase family protein
MNAGRALAPRAMILAAGRGSRLRPLTDVTPKPLIDVAGHPLIAYGLRLLHASGIEDVVVNVHHLGDKLRAALGDGRRFGVRIRYSSEQRLLDTGGGIRFAAPLLDELLPPGADPSDSPIVVLNGDVVSEIPIREVVRFHRARGALATFVLRDDPQAAAYGTFGCDADGRIRRFLGRGEPASVALRERMFASVQVLDPRMLALMPAERPFSTMRELYPDLFERGEPFYGWPYDGRWYTADTPSDLDRARVALSGSGRPDYMDALARPMDD